MVDPEVWRGQETVSNDLSYYACNNSCFMTFALKSVHGLTEVGVLHGDGPRTPPGCLDGPGKSFN